MENPWWVAEHLLHEALHQKLYDFRHGHTLFELRAKRDDAALVHAVWNPPRLTKANQWDFNRVLAAFHVYVHMAHLAMMVNEKAAELVATYGPVRGMIKSSQAYDRAYYLGESLTERCWPHLGPAGKALVEWLMSALEFMNASPPPREARVHLYLDRYEKEANQVEKALPAERPFSRLAEGLSPLAKSELQGARDLLAAIGAEEGVNRLDDVAARYRDEELGKSFPSVRRAIAEAISHSSASRYRLTDSGEHDKALGEMIDRASHQLYPLVAGYPSCVAEALTRAAELRFVKSCNDSTGKLLAVLAAAVPTRARILEIGTGAGVGTAWLVAGLGARGDVQIVTVEVDHRLSEATRGSAWPSYVTVQEGDAAKALASLGTFDLVFADAAPIKYGHIGSLLPAVAPGGILIADDLQGDVDIPAEQLAEKDAFRATVLNDPSFRAVEIGWSSGLLLATRIRV
jgi:predicted O-methyltransferase YrrM